MMRFFRIPVLLLFLSGAPIVLAGEFQDTIEETHSLRTLGVLRVSNLRGNVTIHSWAIDKVRIRARRFVDSGSEEEATKLFASMGVRYRNENREVEILADYNQGFDLSQKLKQIFRTTIEFLPIHEERRCSVHAAHNSAFKI